MVTPRAELVERVSDAVTAAHDSERSEREAWRAYLFAKTTQALTRYREASAAAASARLALDYAERTLRAFDRDADNNGRHQ